MQEIKIFVASSSELKDERDQFRMFISEENDIFQKKGIYLKIVQWENFLDAISNTRHQDEYNNAISECDIVLCLFFTKVGKYTAEEFNTAYQNFKASGKPKIWTYFKDAPVKTSSITEEINTLLEFKKKIADLGHFHTEYINTDNLINQFRNQLNEFITLFEEDLTKKNTASNFGASLLTKKESVKNSFNEMLTVRLIEAIRRYSKKANDFLTTNSDWKTNADLRPTVKRIIISGYVGVLGIQLRKLMSIGEEDFSESKLKRYLENCLLTAKRALQLMCYALISKLWDHKLNNRNCKHSQSQTDALVKFFKNATEENLTGFANLLKTLIDIFSENNLDLPIPQLMELQPNLQPGSSFKDACLNLHSVNELLSKTSFNADDCIESEKNLTIVLEHLNFLAEYKMISIKGIDFSLQRNDTEGHYLHNYSLLEGDSHVNNIQGKVRKDKTPVFSDAVLLFKENYRQNINMVPFIIDYNALELKSGSKICFYSFRNTYSDGNLNYTFIEDNSKVTIKKSKNPKPSDENTINNWLAIEENRKDMNLDNVFNMFHEAKKILTGEEEESIEETF